MKENWGISEAKSQTGGILECLNRIRENLDVKESSPIGVKNSQVGHQQTQKRFPILIICDTKISETDDCDILTALCKNEVIIITLSSLIGDATTDKYLTDSSKVKKLLFQNAAKLESQINLYQESAHWEQHLEISPDETVKLAVAKSIFPSIPKLNSIFDFIEAHYQQPISLRDVALSVGYSAAYLTNLVRSQTGKSVNRWITDRRMAEACSLLKDTDLSIDCIASAVGYSSRWCFFRHFRNSFGVTPGDWRSKARSSVTKTCEEIP